jgi:hypothetical protein
MIVDGYGVPDGYVARYRPLNRRQTIVDGTVFKFAGLDAVVARIPLPEARTDARPVAPSPDAPVSVEGT